MGMQISQSAMQLQNSQPLQSNATNGYQTQHHSHQEVSVPLTSNPSGGVSNPTSSGVNAPAPSQHDTTMPPLWNSDMSLMNGQVSQSPQVQLQNNMLNAYHYSGNQHLNGQHQNSHSSTTYSSDPSRGESNSNGGNENSSGGQSSV